MRSFAAFIATVLLTTSAAIAGDQALEIGHQERSETDVVLDWPFTLVAKKPRDAEHCRRVRPHRLEIREQGRRIGTMRLRRSDSATTHFLLIDTSRSMSGKHGITRRRLVQTRLAARHYIDRLSEEDALRPNDRVALLSFDDDLIMHSPPVSVSEPSALLRLRRGAANLDGGYLTAFRDALYRLVDNVDGVDERYVVVLLSDGMDTTSVVGEAVLRRLIARANNVTLFGIGIALADGPHRKLLRSLAEVSGGAYYDIRDHRDPDRLGSKLRERFDEIQRHLRNQQRASYVTRIVPGGDEGVMIDVAIESRDPRCEVTGYKRQRFVPPEETSSGGGDAAWTLLDEAAGDGSGLLRLGVNEMVVDVGPLATWTEEAQSRANTTPDVRKREMDLIVPPLQTQLEGGGSDAVDLVRRWVERELPGDAESVVVASHLGPRLTNGKILLHNRPLIARAVFDAFPDYREWVLRKLEPYLFRSYREALPAGIADEQVRLLVRARLERPRVEDLEARLAVWLSDIGVRELSRRLERDWIDARLRGAARTGLEDELRRWRILSAWLRPPDRVRVVAPLFLAYDAESETFGFHRIVLPRLRHMPDQNFPDRPLAMELHPHLHAPDAGLEVHSVEQHRVGDKELRDDRFPGKELELRDLHRVVWELDPRPGERRLDVVVDVTDGGFEPFCVVEPTPDSAAWLPDTPSCQDLAPPDR